MSDIESCCPFCNAPVDNVKELDKHLKSDHKINKLNCFVCDFSSKQIQKWLHHLTSQHAFEVPRLLQLASTRYAIIPKKTKCIKQEIISDILETGDTLNKNLATLLVKNTFRGEEIMSESTNERNLSSDDAHDESLAISCSSNSLYRGEIMKSTGQDLTCHECKQTFTKEIYLQKHKLKHCGFCSYVAPSHVALNRHLCTHSKEKPFHCPLCEFTAVMKSTITVHMRTHTDERPFSCNQCDYAARTSSQLASHKLCHSGEKPFQCKDCGKKFTQSGSLGRHVRQTCIYSIQSTSTEKTPTDNFFLF